MLKQTYEGSQENVLSGMLLHVVAAPVRINQPSNACTRLRRSAASIEVHDPSVISSTTSFTRSLLSSRDRSNRCQNSWPPLVG